MPKCPAQGSHRDVSLLTFFDFLDYIIRQGEALLCVWKWQDFRLMLRYKQTPMPLSQIRNKSGVMLMRVLVFVPLPEPACRTWSPSGPRWPRRRPGDRCFGWTCLGYRSCESGGSLLTKGTHRDTQYMFVVGLKCHRRWRREGGGGGVSNCHKANTVHTGRHTITSCNTLNKPQWGKTRPNW